MTNAPSLTLHQLTIGLGSQRLVKPLDLNIRAGQCLGLVGESGSGKSLTALSILQLLPPEMAVSTQSQIIWQGQNLLSYSERQMRRVRGGQIGMIFQDALAAFNPVLTLGQQIQEALDWHVRPRLTRKALLKKIYDQLIAVGLPEPARICRSYPHELSGGMRQRAMIAMVLCLEPQLLIADEPTTALDVTIQAQIIELLKTLKHKQLTLLFISHNLAIVSSLADDIAVLKAGDCVETERASTFFRAPKADYSRQLLAAVPDLTVRTVPSSTQTKAPPSTQAIALSSTQTTASSSAQTTAASSAQTSPPLDALQSLQSLEARQPLLHASNINVYFQTGHWLDRLRHRGRLHAVNAVQLAVYPGCTLAIVGESGSGKTTLAKALLQLVPTTSGTIQLRDRPITAYPPKQRRRLLQMIWQDPYTALNPRLRIVDAVAEGLQAQQPIHDRATRHAKVDQALQQVQLSPDMKWRYPHQLSGGQRQRVCIARALILQPQLLILDEPTSALDVSNQAQILMLLKQLQREQGLTYILITHDLALVAQLADTVAVMKHGQIVEANDVASLFHHPQQAYTQELLAAVPQLKTPSVCLEDA